MYIPASLLKCVADSSRVAISDVYIDIDRKQAYATDGKVLVAVPIAPDPGEVSGYVSREAIQQAEKSPKSQRGLVWHGEEVTKVRGIAYPNPHAELPADQRPIFPNIDTVMPKHTTPVLAVDTSLLCNAGMVLTPDKSLVPSVVLAMDITSPVNPLLLRPAKPCVVHNVDWQDAFAILMPIRHDAVSAPCPVPASVPTNESPEQTAALAQQLETVQANAAAAHDAMQTELIATRTAFQQLHQAYAALQTAHKALEEELDDMREDQDLMVQELLTIVEGRTRAISPTQ